MLPASQRLGVISLLPKGDKPKDLLQNLRPVTLLNSGYKLVSGSLAYRINELLPRLINEQQAGFVKGRYIGECIRTTADVFDYANKNKKEGLLLLINFQKAFDSVSFKYILRVLGFFGFKSGIINWVKTLLENFSACINLAGNLTKLFEVLRGARQGDPIASPLFVLAIEILCINFRNSRNIEPYTLSRISVLLSLFADDMSIFLKYCKNNLRNAVYILNQFYQLSGLKIQLQKTQVIVFGPLPEGNYKLCPEIELKWAQDFVLLGIHFNPNMFELGKNFEIKIQEIQEVVKNWRHRFLTPLGRNFIAKTLLLPKISHISLVLPCLDKTLIKKIENIVYNFIWKGSDKIAREDSKKIEIRGGLNMPDIHISWQAYKLSWFKRLSTTNASWGKIFEVNLKTIYPNASINDVFIKFGTFHLLELSKKFPS